MGVSENAKCESEESAEDEDDDCLLIFSWVFMQNSGHFIDSQHWPRIRGSLPLGAHLPTRCFFEWGRQSTL